jgi:uncharacterized protein
MATNIKVRVIDADAHVLESEHTWDYLEPSERKFRPRVFSSPDDPVNQHWMLDNRICGQRMPSLSEAFLKAHLKESGRNIDTPKASAHMDDVALRLQHLDELGIDHQVLHNSLWIRPITDRPEVEAALCRSWNRWMADIWKQGRGRLSWVAVLPYMTIVEALDQMRFAYNNGAVGICLRPHENARHITNPYYYPIYDEASRLNMAAIMHVANANTIMYDFASSPWDGGEALARFRAPVVVACHSLLLSDLHEMFPTLRWGFIEAAAGWVPWILREAKSRMQAAGLFGVKDDGVALDRMLGTRQIFVTCQTNDDIPYIVKEAGLDCLVIGTDYGHPDPSSDIDAITTFRRKYEGVLSDEAVANILEHNPKRLYALN